MLVSIEQHVDWIVDRMIEMREAGYVTIEATETAQAGWARHNDDCSTMTLYPLANTWYTGANVPGKPRTFPVYIGGLGRYREICADAAAEGYRGFTLR